MPLAEIPEKIQGEDYVSASLRYWKAIQDLQHHIADWKHATGCQTPEDYLRSKTPEPAPQPEAVRCLSKDDFDIVVEACALAAKLDDEKHPRSAGTSIYSEAVRRMSGIGTIRTVEPEPVVKEDLGSAHAQRIADTRAAYEGAKDAAMRVLNATLDDIAGRLKSPRSQPLNARIDELLAAEQERDRLRAEVERLREQVDKQEWDGIPLSAFSPGRLKELVQSDGENFHLKNTIAALTAENERLKASGFVNVKSITLDGRFVSLEFESGNAMSDFLEQCVPPGQAFQNARAGHIRLTWDTDDLQGVTVFASGNGVASLKETAVQDVAS